MDSSWLKSKVEGPFFGSPAFCLHKEERPFLFSKEKKHGTKNRLD